MPTFNASVSVTSGLTDAGIKIDGQEIVLGPSGDGGFAGIGQINSDASPIPFEFRATGPAGFPATLKVVLTPAAGGAASTFSKKYVIPDSLLLIANDQIKPS
ncbi:MAG: hypothetical protein ABSD59_07835 [Terracidiphilus sp.]|jgi:hypothetical protein